MRMILAVLCALMVPSVLHATDNTGAWVVKVDLGPRMKFNLLCAIRSDGQAISGPCYPVQGKVLAAQGSVTARKLAFKYFTNFNGSGLQLDFRGTFQADGSVSGPVANRLGDGTFQGAAPLVVDDKTKVWTLNAEFSGIPPYTVVCVFRETGPKIDGPCVIPEGESLNIAGTSDGAKIAFDYDTKYQNQPIHAHYEGSFTGPSASGTVKAGTTTGTFTAKKP